MSRHTAGYLLSAGLGVLGGVLLSLGEAERRALKKYAEYEESLKRAYEGAAQAPIVVDGPHETEAVLKPSREVSLEANTIEDTNEYLREGEEPPKYVNHYLKAQQAAANLGPEGTDTQLFVDGGVNDYGVSYIEEEEYNEDDGRFKGQITIVMNDHAPTFFMDGMQIDDWSERVGESIIVDFYQHVPPNAPPFLYVRNHKRDEDYEVVREIP